MRGKAWQADSWNTGDRITPAYAGKRERIRLPFGNRKDHPRLCGEKRGSKPPKPFTRGSPPPMRGKVYCSQSSKTTGRITPAYAGKSIPGTRRRCNWEDHPRLCGEKFTVPVKISSIIGSPPPMRGKVCIADLQDAFFGITPAYAGKRGKHALYTCRVRDHPRLCGEKHEHHDQW